MLSEHSRMVIWNRTWHACMICWHMFFLLRIWLGIDCSIGTRRRVTMNRPRSQDWDALHVDPKVLHDNGSHGSYANFVYGWCHRGLLEFWTDGTWCCANTGSDGSKENNRESHLNKNRGDWIGFFVELLGGEMTSTAEESFTLVTAL
ncbi:hypothetical protein C8J56DRAFT_960846 [Mycena floridula]|nr:hypothetical protein C8J56DRAFT_960846 [Mycena floridula]